LLAELYSDMVAFYSLSGTRERYQQMVDADASSQPVTEAALRSAIVARRPASVLEFGCGSGRVYKGLLAEGFDGKYVGVEMSEDVIAHNAKNYPEAAWVCGSILDAELAAGAFDVVYSYFVLEHCVYPECVLKRALQLIKPSGVLLLVFPDFVETGRFGSQMLGYRRGRASDHLRAGRPIHAVVALYESRIRLPRALRRAVTDFGPFPVNLNVKCLVPGTDLEPDVDAVYISSKVEVHSWAEHHGCHVIYPAGREGHFRLNTLVEIHHPSPSRPTPDAVRREAGVREAGGA